MKKLFYLLAPLLLLAACEADPTPFSDPPPSQNTIEPTRGPVATRAIATRAVTAGPTPTRGPGGSIVIAGVGTPSREITSLPPFIAAALYDSLLRVDPVDGHLLPGLAQEWSISDDALTFTFTLRDDVEWHDGTPLTADDVVFTLQSLSSPDIRVRPAADFGTLEQVTASDDRTVTVTFQEPYCAALTYIGTLPILPGHVLEGKNLAQLANEDLIGTGPLVLDEWTDESVTFTRNADYWNGAPQIIDWTYQIFPNQTSALTAVQQNRADFVASASEFQAIQNIPYPRNEFYALSFNNQRAPLDELAVRQALSAAIDRVALQATGAVADVNLESSTLESFWAAAPVEQVPFNPARSRQALAAAGWRDADRDGILEKDGKPLELTLWLQAEDPHSELTAQLLRRQLEQVGVRAILKMTDRTLFLTRVFLQEYDLALVHFNIPLDPDQHYLWAESEDDPGYGLNISGYLNTDVDAALASGNSAQNCSPTERKAEYEQVFEQIASDVPMLFLYAPTEVLNVSPPIQGVQPSSFAGPFWNLNTWQAVR